MFRPIVWHAGLQRDGSETVNAKKSTYVMQGTSHAVPLIPLDAASKGSFSMTLSFSRYAPSRVHQVHIKIQSCCVGGSCVSLYVLILLGAVSLHSTVPSIKQQMNTLELHTQGIIICASRNALPRRVHAIEP